MVATGATLAIAVRGNLQTERVRPQMRNLAEKIDWRFRLATFQFAVCWAHAAERVDAAISANRPARGVALADVFQPAFPTLLQ